MRGRRDTTFYALSSADRINPPKHFVFQCPPGLGTLCSQVPWQGPQGKTSEG